MGTSPKKQLPASFHGHIMEIYGQDFYKFLLLAVLLERKKERFCLSFLRWYGSFRLGEEELLGCYCKR